MDGIINVYKEKGFTSHDVVAKLRGILHQKKIGHTGTLDPEAEGVLPDMTGEILQTADCSGVTREALQEVLCGFTGNQLQVPPMYSALKVNGKKLYELAREGKTVERKARSITIYALELVDFVPEEGTFTIDVTCSKGTYIRTLCNDIGEKLGCFGAMKSLLRTRVGVFELEKAFTLAQIEQFMAENVVEAHIVQVDALFAGYPAYRIRDEFAAKLANGNPLLPRFLQPYDPDRENPVIIRELSEGQEFLVYDETGRFKAMYRKGEKDLRVRKMF